MPMPILLLCGWPIRGPVVDRQQLHNGLDSLGLTIAEQGADNIILYCRELLKWNRRMNLVARNTGPVEALEKHFLDSLTLLKIMLPAASAMTLLDVGTGAGFPGLVLAAVLPELQVTLVEPRQKRVAFLQHIIRTLRLDNVHLFADRLENGAFGRGDFSYITSRAVANVDQFLAMVRHLAVVETRVICMRGGNEKAVAAGRQTRGPWRQVQEVSFPLPWSKAARLLLVFQKC